MSSRPCQCGNKEIITSAIGISVSAVRFSLSLFFFQLPIYTCRSHLCSFPLSFSHHNPVMPINHMVIDWPHWECLNPRPRSKGIAPLLFRNHVTGGYLHEGHGSKSRKTGRKGYFNGNSPRTIKVCDNRYFPREQIAGTETSGGSEYYNRLYLYCS